MFPAADGDYIKQPTFRLRHWGPALRAAGIDHRGVYACRHTFAAWSIAAGVQLFYLSRIMGTSVTQIDATYGHLVPDSEEYLRGLLDSYDAVTKAAEGSAMTTNDWSRDRRRQSLADLLLVQRRAGGRRPVRDRVQSGALAQVAGTSRRDRRRVRQTFGPCSGHGTAELGGFKAFYATSGALGYRLVEPD